MNPLELYLERVERELRSMPKWKQEEELRELRSHLEQRVEDFEREGLKVEKAQTRAVEAFGSARALGSKLCDAWEGIAFSWWRFAASICGVMLLWLVAQLGLIFAGFALTFWPKSALFPELSFVWAFAFFSVSFGCGSLLSLRLRRRGPLAVGAMFALLWALATVIPLFEFIFSRMTGPNGTSIPLLPVHLLLSLFGAMTVRLLRTRQLKLATVSGPKLSVSPHSKRRVRVKPVMTTFGVLALVGLGIVVRVQLALHPTTPVGVLRASLLMESGLNSDLEPATILALRELPTRTLAERAGTEKRIEFKVEMHAKKDYAARRVAYYRRQLASPSERKLIGEKPLRLSLARMQRNRQVIQGVALIVKTKSGWQTDEKSFDRSQLRAWCYDIYFER